MSKHGISKHYVQLTNALSDLWGERLSAVDFRAMMFIINRTIRWDNTGELIPRKHVLGGVPNTSTGPSGLSYATWKRCTRTLRGEGLIQTEITKRGMVIEVIPQRVTGGPLGSSG
jgi:hypothetical protein